MRDVLVTKATGTTGRYVVERLAERGASVKAASRNPSSVTQGNVVPILFDWENRSTWDVALDVTVRPDPLAQVARCAQDVL